VLNRAFEIAQISRRLTCTGAMIHHVPNNLESDELQRARSWQHLLWIWAERCYKRLSLKPNLFFPVPVLDGPPAS